MPIMPTTPPMPIMFRAIPTYLRGTNGNVGTYHCDTVVKANLTIDLAHTVSSGLPGDPSVDDFRAAGGFSELVPEPGGTYIDIGVLYVRYSAFTSSTQTVLGVPNPPSLGSAREYELTAAYYPLNGHPQFTDFESRRYHGFHAKLDDRTDWPIVTMLVWPADCGYQPDQAVEMTFDLTDPDWCDAAAQVDWPTAKPAWGSRLTSASKVGDIGALYLSPMAMRSAGLYAPKIPKGLGAGPVRGGCHGGSSPSPMAPCDVCHVFEPVPPRPPPPPPPRTSAALARPLIIAERRPPPTVVSVSGTEPTGGLIDIQATLRTGGRLALVHSIHGLVQVLRQARSCRPARASRVLDLVGHTAGDDYTLMLGSSPIDLHNAEVATVFADIAAERLLPELGIRTVRLLGCRSTVGLRARQTISGLRNLLGVEVKGVCDILTSSEFVASGFIGEPVDPWAPCPVFSLPATTLPPHPTLPSPIPGFGAGLVRSSHSARANRTVVLPPPNSSLEASIVGAVSTDAGVELHGVLAQPSRHVVLVQPAAPELPTKYRSFDVFFEHEIVAVYYGAARVPLFYRVTDPAALRALVP